MTQRIIGRGIVLIVSVIAAFGVTAAATASVVPAQTTGAGSGSNTPGNTIWG
jgi:hypothetical protein